MKVLAVIPAYNEEESLVATITELIQSCPEVDYLVIDDGSSDNTWGICKQQGFSHIHMPVNTGLSSVFRTGMKYAWRHGYDAAVQLDADGQHVPGYIPEMARALEEQDADIVIASRVLNGEAPSGMRNVGSKLLSWLIKQTTGAVITDPTCGMRLYNRKMIEMFATGFDLHPEPDTVALVARRGGRLTEIPAHVRERQGGESYLTIGRSISYMLRMSLSIILYQWLR